MSTTLVVTTQDELRELVRDAVRAEMRAVATTPAAEWLDARRIAAILDVSMRHVAKLAAHHGLPHHRFGEKLLRFPARK